MTNEHLRLLRYDAVLISSYWHFRDYSLHLQFISSPSQRTCHYSGLLTHKTQTPKSYKMSAAVYRLICCHIPPLWHP